MSDPDKDHSTANSDKGSRDKSPKHEAGEPSPKPTGGKSPAPSSFLAMALFWLALLILVPLLLFFMGNRRVGKPVELTQSQFEQLLIRQRVLEVNVVREMNNPQIVLTGKYRLEAKANLPTKPETTAAPVPEKSASPAAGAAPKVAVPDPEVQEFTATVFYSDELDSMIRKNGGQRKASSATSFWNNPVVSFLLPTLLIVGLLYFMVSRQFRSVGKGPMQFGKSRARLISQDKGKVTFADVSGIEEAKEEVQEVVDFLKDSHKFQALGGRIPKGVLMVGPPGTGKTLLARAIAGEAGVPFFSISGSDFVEMFVGVGASRVRDMFEEGKRQAPCIIFIDEIDAVGRSRFTGVGGGHDEREQTLNALLVEMDGFETNSGVIVSMHDPSRKRQSLEKHGWHLSLPRSTRHREPGGGPVRTGSLGPYIARTGVPITAARCIGPESLAITKSISRNTPASCGKVVLPARLITRPPNAFSISVPSECSSDEPITYIEAPKFSCSSRPTRTNDRSGQFLLGQRENGKRAIRGEDSLTN